MLAQVTTIDGKKTLSRLAGEGSSALPVGTVLSYKGQNVPMGFLPCTGALYDIKQFPALYAILATNRLPNITDQAGQRCIIKAVTGEVDVDDAAIYADVVTLLETAYVPRDLDTVTSMKLVYYDGYHWQGLPLPTANNQVLVGNFVSNTLNGYKWVTVDDILADRNVKSN